jgi:hypothetical protein
VRSLTIVDFVAQAKVFRHIMDGHDGGTVFGRLHVTGMEHHPGDAGSADIHEMG